MSDEQRKAAGRSAFPLSTVRDYELGMTLLDWFAGQAIQAISVMQCWKPYSPEEAAEKAYTYAAAMVAERAKRLG